MDSEFMRLHGARMADAGYCITPIAAGQKWPGEYVNGKWEHKRGWEFLGLTPTPEGLINIWENYPGCGVGKAPKVLLVYRCTEKIDKLSYQPIEVLANGQQFVAYGVHPDTGLPYTWPDESPAETPVDSLPTVTPEQLKAACEEAFALVPEELRAKRLRPSDNGQDSGQRVRSGDNAKATPEAIREALQHIPNPELPWDEWKRVLMATFAASHGDEAAYFDFLEWSRKSTKHNDTTTRKEWTSCRASPPRSLGFGTLHHMARQHGWTPSAGLVFNVDKLVDGVDISGFENMPMDTSVGPFAEPEVTTTGNVYTMMPIVGEPPPPDRFSVSSTGIYTQAPPILLPSGVSQLEWEGRFDGAAPREYLVKKLLPRTGIALLSGPSGAGKSCIAVDLAGSLATGKPFFGLRTRYGGTLVLAAEGYATIKERLLVYRKGKYVIDRRIEFYDGIDEPYKPQFPIAVASIGALPHDDCSQMVSLAEGVDRMMMEQFGTHLRLIVIHTFAAAFCLQDENSSVEVTRVMKVLQELSERTNTLVMPVVHHGKTEGTGVRGSTAFEASADARLTVNYSKNEEGEVSWRRVSLGKSRTEETGWCHNFDLDPVVLGTDEDGEQIVSCNVIDRGEPTKQSAREKPEQKANDLLKAIAQVASNTVLVDSEGWISAEPVKEAFLATAPGEKSASDDAKRKR